MATSKTAGQTAYYVRVSSQSQDIRSQIPEMEAHARGHDSARWYTDIFTGTQMDRPGWAKLMVDMRAGSIRKIVIWRLDRLGRTTSGLVNLLDELRNAKSVLFPCATGPWTRQHRRAG